MKCASAHITIQIKRAFFIKDISIKKHRYIGSAFGFIGCFNHQMKLDFAISPLSMRMSCAVIDLFTTVTKYAQSAISSTVAHLGIRVSFITAFQSVVLSMMCALSDVRTPPGDRLLLVAPYFAIPRRFSYTQSYHLWMRNIRETPLPNVRTPTQ